MTPRTRRSLLLIAISLAIATMAAVLANRWVNKRVADVDATRPHSLSLVAAATDIPFGAAIEAQHLKTVQILAAEAPAGSFTDSQRLIGRIAKSDIYADEILVERRFATPGLGSTLAAVVTPNMRAVSVRVDDVVGVAGFILPGNRVDLIASHAEGSRAWAETILSDVKVLAVDQKASADKAGPVVVRAVTIEVTPEGAQKLARAKQLGALQLALRNPTDKSVSVTGIYPPPEEAVKVASTPAAATAEPQVKPAVRAKTERGTTNAPHQAPAIEHGISVIRGITVSQEAIH